MVDHRVPWRRARHPGAVGQPAGRLAARCPEPEAEMILQARDLRVEFRTRRGTLVAVDDVSFSVARGEVLGVVGESGAGKSLTGLSIIGLLEPPGRIASGEVWLEGKRIDRLPPEDMRRERGLSLLREVGIPAPEARYDNYPHQFSGGMRQRVVIALAIAAEPVLIIADEPTTALDVSIQAQIIQLLKRLAREHG